MKKSISQGQPDGLKALLRFLSIVVMNLLFYPSLFVWTALTIALSPLAFLLWKMATSWSTERIVRQFIWIYGRGWIVLSWPFVRFKRAGFDGLQQHLPVVMVVNHFSFFDTYCMALLPFSNVAFAIRAWPFKMLWYRPFMRLARYLDVETLTWDAVCDDAQKIMERNGNILFFPEGHRSRDGSLGRFYSGAFRLAIESGATIVPLCISGTDRLLPRGRWWVHPAVVCLKALTPIDAARYPGDRGHVLLRNHVKERIAAGLSEIRQQCCEVS